MAQGVHDNSEIGIRTKWSIDLEKREFQAQFFDITSEGEKFLDKATYEVKVPVIQEWRHAKVELGSFEQRGVDESEGSRGVHLRGTGIYTGIEVY